MPATLDLTLTITAPLYPVMTGREVVPTASVKNNEATSQTIVARLQVGPTTGDPAVYDYDESVTVTVAAGGTSIVTFPTWTVPGLNDGPVPAIFTLAVGSVVQTTVTRVWTIVLADGKYVLDTFCQNFESGKLPPLADWPHRLMVAQRDLERMLGVASFGLEEFTERYDYNISDFTQTFWILSPRQRPIVSVSQYGMWWGSARLIASFDTEWLVIDTQMGTVELVPSAIGTTGLLFQAFVEGIQNVMPGGFAMYTRVPCLFKITYKAGLDADNLSAAQRASIQYGIARHALIGVLSLLNPRGAASDSLSIDGASQSMSYSRGSEYGGLQFQLQSEEKDWLAFMCREYGLDLTMDIV